MPDFNVIPLWVTPLYVGTIPTAHSFVDKLKNVDWKRPDTDNGFVTTNTYLLDQTEFKNLKTAVTDHIETYVREVCNFDHNIKFYITNSWGTKHTKGDWAIKHFHPNSLFSGVLYLQCDPNSGEIVFYQNSGFSTLVPQTFEFDFSQQNMYNSTKYSVNPKDDMIVLFPSHLEHSVNISQSDHTRLAIAFNVFVNGTLGKNNPENISDLRLY